MLVTKFALVPIRSPAKMKRKGGGVDGKQQDGPQASDRSRLAHVQASQCGQVRLGFLNSPANHLKTFQDVVRASALSSAIA